MCACDARKLLLLLLFVFELLSRYTHTSIYKVYIKSHRLPVLGSRRLVGDDVPSKRVEIAKVTGRVVCEPSKQGATVRKRMF